MNNRELYEELHGAISYVMESISSDFGRKLNRRLDKLDPAVRKLLQSEYPSLIELVGDELECSNISDWLGEASMDTPVEERVAYEVQVSVPNNIRYEVVGATKEDLQSIARGDLIFRCLLDDGEKALFRGSDPSVVKIFRLEIAGADATDKATCLLLEFENGEVAEYTL